MDSPPGGRLTGKHRIPDAYGLRTTDIAERDSVIPAGTVVWINLSVPVCESKKSPENMKKTVSV